VLLQYLQDVGFDRAPRPLGVDDAGREVLSFIEGDVPIPPFPLWSMSADMPGAMSWPTPEGAC
jgi:hypothetical protein